MPLQHLRRPIVNAQSTNASIYARTFLHDGHRRVEDNHSSSVRKDEACLRRDWVDIQCGPQEMETSAGLDEQDLQGVTRPWSERRMPGGSTRLSYSEHATQDGVNRRGQASYREYCSITTMCTALLELGGGEDGRQPPTRAAAQDEMLKANGTASQPLQKDDCSTPARAAVRLRVGAPNILRVERLSS